VIKEHLIKDTKAGFKKTTDNKNKGLYLEVVHDLVDGAASLPDDHRVDARINLHLLFHHRFELIHNLKRK
jgi:hypothetical protein